MKADRLRQAAATSVSLLGVCVVLLGCGDDALVGASIETPDSTTTDTGRLPAKTRDSVVDVESSTTISIAEHSGEIEGKDRLHNGGDGLGSGVDVDDRVRVGAEVLAAENFSYVDGSRVGLIANRASTVGGRHTADLLIEAPGVELVALFAPEHGIRGDLGAGEEVIDGTDPSTGLPVYSLFDDTRQPTPAVLRDLDVLVFDLQDIGARFYTYISTMGLAMQAAAEADIRFVVLDRPTPLGAAPTDGPVLHRDMTSFVGLYPIPGVHGMTVGELATAIQGERWLPGLDELDLEVIEMTGWRPERGWHDTGLHWTPPSPGLPTAQLSLSYPATVLLEATTLSYGHGTEAPFGQFGAPWLDAAAVAESLQAEGLPGVRFVATTFAPRAAASGPSPRFAGEVVPAVRIEIVDPAEVRPMTIGVHVIHAVLQAAAATDPAPPVIDRPEFFDLLIGDREVRRALEAGADPGDVVDGWRSDLDRFEEIRSRYSRY